MEASVLKLRSSSHVVAIAYSLGRKPKEIERKEPLAAKRRQQMDHAQIAVAASRLPGFLPSNPLGLHPRLHAAVASRLRKCATSKSGSDAADCREFFPFRFALTSDDYCPQIISPQV
jgi:hypothetical protein